VPLPERRPSHLDEITLRSPKKHLDGSWNSLLKN